MTELEEIGLGSEDEDIEEEEEEEKTKIKYQKKEKSTRRKIQCSQCGNLGHQARTCPGKDSQKESKDYINPAPPLTISQFDSVRESVKHGMVSKDISIELDVPLREVNMAMGVSDYEMYRNRRLEM